MLVRVAGLCVAPAAGWARVERGRPGVAAGAGWEACDGASRGQEFDRRAEATTRCEDLGWTYKAAHVRIIRA